MPVMVQNKNSIVQLLAMTDIILTDKAMYSGLGARMANTAPTIWKKGAPGG